MRTWKLTLVVAAAAATSSFGVAALAAARVDPASPALAHDATSADDATVTADGTGGIGADELPAWATPGPGAAATATGGGAEPDWAPVSLPDGTLAADDAGNYLLVDVDLGIQRLALADDGDDGDGEGTASAVAVWAQLEAFAGVGAVRAVAPGDPLVMQWCTPSSIAADACLFAQSPAVANEVLGG